MTAADHDTPIEHNDEWADLADTIHTVIAENLGDCPDNGIRDGGLCHDIAEVVINSGWKQ